MITSVATPEKVHSGEYYTDFQRLYRVIDVCNMDKTALVENCSTEFSAWIELETLSVWKRVIPN